MSTVVLKSLMYNICEMYVDDCVVYATSEEQFCERLEQVCSRFRDTHIFQIWVITSCHDIRIRNPCVSIVVA